MSHAMVVLFWASLLVIVYAYVGYALWLRLLVTFRRRAVQQAPVVVDGAQVASVEPSVSIIMAVHNEEANLPAKLANLRAADYPAHKLQVVVASDGSTDRTAEILERSSGVTAVLLPQAGGKAAALNAAVARASGDILVFFDARQRVDPEAVRHLTGNFADPEIGAVSGELLLEDADGRPAADALGLYWRIEKTVRRLESATGSVVGVTGAIYAMRRELFVPLPKGTILDDVLVPMNVARAGRRVIFEPAAIARDRIFQQPGKEFARKVRTLTGNYQLLQLAPWLLSPANPLLFRFISHKLLRLLVPFLLVLLLVSSLLAGGAVYRAFFGAQLVFYALAAWGMASPAAKRVRPVAIAETFTMLNLAAALAFFNFAAGRRKVWV